MGGKSTHVRHNKGNQFVECMRFVMDLGIDVVREGFVAGKEVDCCEFGVIT